MSESKTSKRRLKAHEKQLTALGLRKAGKTFEAIAAELGYAGPAGSYKAVMSALKRTLQEPADEVRRLEIERIDAMWEKVWWQIKSGDHKAVNVLLRLMERRAKLLGLDMPKKIAHTDPTGTEPAEINLIWPEENGDD